MLLVISDTVKCVIFYHTDINDKTWLGDYLRQIKKLTQHMFHLRKKTFFNQDQAKAFLISTDIC